MFHDGWHLRFHVARQLVVQASVVQADRFGLTACPIMASTGDPPRDAVMRGDRVAREPSPAR